MKAARTTVERLLNTSSELELKIVLVGASKSGKTSLVRRLCDKTFREEFVPTLGFDLSVVAYGSYQGRPVKLHLWDVAGSQLNAVPCHHALIADGADGVLYVMDVTNRESLQAVDDWDRALAKYLPPWTSKLLVGHKADLPAYVVNDEALSLYVARASGFRGWCLTVGSSEYGDYDVAARRGGATADGGGRHKGQSLSGEKQLSVSEAVRTLLGHIFRTGGARGDGARTAMVVGQAAGAGGASPLPCPDLDTANDIVDQLGLAVVERNIRRRASDRECHRTASGPASHDAVDDDKNEDCRSSSVSGEHVADMMELLRRGRGPDGHWRRDSFGGEGEAEGDDQVTDFGGDPGWRYFAGRVGREEAEALLRGRPEGTFFLRRKGPSLLVLSYVAKSPGTPGSGRKTTRSPSPSRMSASDSSSSLTLMTSPTSMARGTRGGSHDFGGVTSVQHALLMYEADFFSDAKGRLGRFSTLEELLKSKISALARYPLSFRRHRGRYVLVEEVPDDTPTDEANPEVTPSGGARPARTPTAHSNPFARDDNNDVNEASVFDLLPVISGDIFGGQKDAAGIAGLSPLSTSAARLSPPGSKSLPTGVTGTSYDDHLTGRGSQGFRRVSGSNNSRGDELAVAGVAAAPVGSGDWIDRRSRTNSRTGGVGGASSGGGGSIWMEAAAAAKAEAAINVGKHSASESGTLGIGLRSARKGAEASGGGSAIPAVGAGIPGAGKSTALISPPESGGDLGRLRNASAGRRAWKSSGSAPYVDDAWSVSSTSTLEPSAAGEAFSRASGDVGGRARQPSAMALAAEEAAAITAAKGHPEAKRVEERTLAAQSMVERALAKLEDRLRPLVERRQSPVAAGGQGSSRGLPSTYRSPRDSRPPFAARSEAEEQGHRWVAVAPTGGAAAIAAAPLAGAAALLMERACTRRKELLGSAYALRQRAISLAVAEASVSEGEGADPGSPSSQSFLAGENIASPPSDARWSRGANTNSQDALGGGRDAPRGKTTADGGAFRRSTTEQHAGFPGLSTCGDFEQILGEEAPGRAGGSSSSLATSLAAKVYEDREQQVVSGSWLNGREGSFSDSSVRAERSTFGADLFTSKDGRLESASRGSHRGGSLKRGVVIDFIPDSWRVLSREVAAAEERCRGIVADWDAAGGAFRDACEDDLGVMEGSGTRQLPTQ